MKREVAIDWGRVGELCRKSVLGGGLSEEQQQFLQRAFAQDPVTYGRVSRAARERAIDEYRKGLTGG